MKHIFLILPFFFLKVGVSIELTFNLKFLTLPEEKTIKNAANNLQKMKESSLIPQPIESTTKGNYVMNLNAMIQDHKPEALFPRFLGP